METVALTDLLGRPVMDSAGLVAGRVREVALAPQEDRARVSLLVVKTKHGDRIVPVSRLQAVDFSKLQVDSAAPEWNTYTASEGLLLMGRDLLDQQIIDVDGRKVVRVNDAELVQERSNGNVALRVFAVDIGPRGAVRRLMRGIVPAGTLRRFVQHIPAKMIPWEFVDLIETDPARRVKLKIALDRLATLHPADIADIVEDLAPAEREAVFETLDEEVAAEALEEIDPKLQVSIVNSLDSDKAADIVEEMDPDAAADLLADLSPERSEEILKEMQPEEREEVSELLEHEEDTAAGRMTTDYLAVTVTASVSEAIDQLRYFEGGIESLSTIYLTDIDGKLVGAVALAQLALARPDTDLASLSKERVISVPENAHEHDFAETFDKYNLLTLPVVDENGALKGVITADDVIAMLRKRL
jgi:CBS domain-containing protein/sporulation protein YlmC with PRC-barrel domain